MKKIYSFIFTLSFVTGAFAQTASSVSNGNWTSPLTWNCTCVPTNGYSVTISHNVTMNTSMLFNSGGVTINNTGTLIQDAALNRDIWINGGYFNNSGLVNIRYLAVSAGSITNPGSFTVSAFSNTVSFNNTGSIQMDSMHVAGNFTNAATGKITGDSILNSSTMINNGRINVTWGTNAGVFKNNNYHSGYSFTNAGNYENYDSLMLTGSIWNNSVFSNKTGAKLNTTKNFHNYIAAHTASFENNGTIKIFDSWYNTDTVKGNGYFSVADTSANSGVMKGTFQFCDLTPPAAAPFIDLNSGSVGVGITWCTAAGIDELTQKKNVAIYPNPNNGSFVISADVNDKESLSVINELGQEIKTVQFEKGTARIEGLAPGIYFVSGVGSKGKIVVTN